MTVEIKTITLTNRMGPVNCYLLQTEKGYVLVDTGWKHCREELVQELLSAGCNEDNLQLIFLTHGDFDHIGNCRYISDTFQAKVAMHWSDLGMAQNGDMFFNRKAGGFFVRFLAKLMFRLPLEDQFTPELQLHEDFPLSDYGIDGKVLHIPGHSLGSVGLLLSDGWLFGGDLLENKKKPQLSSIMDDKDMAHSSIELLKTLNISTVFPGHGEPFEMDDFLQYYNTSPGQSD